MAYEHNHKPDESAMTEDIHRVKSRVTERRFESPKAGTFGLRKTHRTYRKRSTARREGGQNAKSRRPQASVARVSSPLAAGGGLNLQRCWIPKAQMIIPQPSTKEGSRPSTKECTAM